MLRTILFLFAHAVGLSHLFAASPDAAMAHFDKSFYVSGEVVWYKLYLPAATQGKDFSVRALVFDGTGALAGESFLPAGKKGVCHGYHTLPFNAPAGVYTFVFSATRKNGQIDELLRANLPVYNDLMPWDPKNTVTPVSTDIHGPAFPSDLKVSISLAPGSPPRPGQVITLQVNVTDGLGSPIAVEGSLSVVDDALCGAKVFPPGNVQLGKKTADGSEWLTGIYHKGMVRHADGRLMTSSLIPVLDIEAQRLHFAKSENGAFAMQLPAYTGTRRLQMVGMQEEPLRVNWDTESVNIAAEELMYTEGVLRYLDLSKKRKKIYQNFGGTEFAPTPAVEMPKPEDWKARQTFNVQDYEHFPDLATFFQEVIWRVKFSKKGERYAARMYNTDMHQDFPEGPLFLVDQKATFDADFVARLDPASIERIDLMSDAKLLRKLYPAISGGGLVRIQTLSGDLPLSKEKEVEILRLPGFQTPIEFPVPASGMPKLRPVAFWRPSFSTDKNGAAQLTFIQPDDRSTFCAEILVQGPDGRRGYARFCYEVVESR